MQNEVANRGINHLVHFTRLDNVPTILTHGLVPRQQLEQNLTGVVFNDSFRHDCRKGANCLSITHPNHKMFYKLRCNEPSEVWVVIGFKPDLLWELPCLFAYENAASSRIANMSDQELSGLAAFQRMFWEWDGKPPRSQLQLRDFETTNPQAEVLVQGVIPPSYIRGVAFASDWAMRRYSIKLQGYSVQTISHPYFFERRNDWSFW